MRLTAVLFLALLLTILSGGYQRYGPLRQVEGEGFCPGVELCFRQVQGAGFPLPYLLDNPQVTLNGSLDLTDDDVRPGIFALDLLFYALLLAVGAHLLGKGAEHRREAATVLETPGLPRA
jgi:hypothetical protein